MKNQKIFLITEGLMTFQKSIFKACLGVLFLTFSMISQSISMNNFDFQQIMEMAEQVQKSVEEQQRPTQNNNAQQNPFVFNSHLNNLYSQRPSSTTPSPQMSEAMREGFEEAQDILNTLQPTLNFMGNNFASFLQGGDNQAEVLIQNSNMTEAHKRGFLAGREVLKDLTPLFTSFSDENDEEEDGEASPQTPDSPEPLEDTFVRKSFQSLKKTVEEFFESQQKILDGEYDFTDILPALAAWGIDGLIIVNDGLDILTGGAWGTLNELMEKGAKVVQTTVRRTLREDFDVSQSTSQTAGDCSGLFVYVCPAKGISALNSIKILKTKKGLIGSLTEVKNSSLLEKPLLVTKGQNGKIESVRGGQFSSKNRSHFEKLKAELSRKEIESSTPIGSALKEDIYHRCPSFVSRGVENGRVFSMKGGDGKSYKLSQFEGSLNNKNGVFEYVVDSKNNLVHQRFIPNGRITGFPNQIVKK